MSAISWLPYQICALDQGLYYLFQIFYCLNGSLVVYFQGGKGLRLGDPLLPYLSVIYQGWSTRVPGFNNLKFHPHCKELGLTHLSFADDLLMFSAADLH